MRSSKAQYDWNLSQLIDGNNSKKDDLNNKMLHRMRAVEKKVEEFNRIKKRLSPSISSSRFFSIMKDIEEINERLSVLGGYASLLYSSDTQSDEAGSLLTRISQWGSDIENNLLFFDLWWKKSIDQKNANRIINQAGELREFLRHKRQVSRFSLSEPEEKIINIKDVTGSSALVKLYDKITNSFEFTIKINGKYKKLNREQLSEYFKNANSRTRESAYKSLYKEYGKSKGVLGEIYQNLVLEWQNEGLKLRNYPSPISMRNIDNNVDDKTVETLLTVCKKNADVFQNYFQKKAKILGMKKLRRYDIYARLPTKSTRESKKKANSANRHYSFEQASKLVLDTLNDFSTTLGGYAKRVFDEKHIDYSLRPGKRNGAFCSSISPNITPYVLVNFVGKTSDVFTLAHEIGHAIHSMAASKKSILVSEAPLPLAETASTFSELLLSEKILDTVTEQERQNLLLQQIDDLYATIMRQSFFTLFEKQAHDKIPNGAATTADISRIYMQNLKEQFSNSVSISDDFELEWSAIPHFYHSPFYCYAYAFGNLLSLSIFSTYKKEGDEFVKTYENILSAGGSKKPEELLAENGMDISKPSFWQNGFNYIRDYIKKI